MRDKPIFILGCHKSGTSLLRALLDGHSRLSVIPYETHFLREAGFEDRYPLSHGHWIERRRDGAVARSLAAAILAVRSDDPHGGFAPPPRIRQQILQALERAVAGVEDETPHDPAMLARQILRSHLNALDSLMPLADIAVEKSVGTFEYVEELRAIFPGCRFVHVSRDFDENLRSLIQYKSRARFVPYLRSAEAIRRSHLCASRNAAASDYLVVTLSSLRDDRGRSEAMHMVADYLGLEWQEILTVPTMLGKAWHGNSQGTKASAVHYRRAKHIAQILEPRLHSDSEGGLITGDTTWQSSLSFLRDTTLAMARSLTRG